MIIHPDGNGDGKGHISVYLAIVGTSSLLADWEVNASFSFLIFDQIHDNYTVMRGTNYSLMQEWSGVFAISRLNGVSRNVSLMQNSKLPLMVNLVNDRCVFGVDLYVVNKQGIGECTLWNDVKPFKHEWKITEFTKLKNKVYSEEFMVKGYKWKLSLHPTGDGSQNGQSISIFLESVDAKGFDCQKRVNAKFNISIKNKISGKDGKWTGYFLSFLFLNEEYDLTFLNFRQKSVNV
ncbi:hypothetical protein P3L10_015307 [Capsicum annuum]